MGKLWSKYFAGCLTDDKFEVIILIGSDSDQTMLDESGMLQVFGQVGVSYHQSQVSAHRHEGDLRDLCLEAINERGAKVFIGVAGMAAALPGAIAAVTKRSLPVLGVALDSGFLGGLDAMLSISRMPKGVPVAYMGIGVPGLVNAAMIACQILSLVDDNIAAKFLNYRALNSKEPEFGVRCSPKKKAE